MFTTTQVIRQPSGLPDRTKVKGKLTFDAISTNTSGAFTTLVLKCNDVFDPTGSFGNAQPYLYDQWSTMYSNYLVTGCKVMLTGHIGSTGVTSTSQRRLFLCFTNRASAFSSGAHLMEQPYGMAKDMSINGGNAPVLKGYMPCNKMFGLTRQQYLGDATNWGAVVTGSPTNLTYVHVASEDPYVGTTCETRIRVDMKFYIIFYNRSTPAVSS